MALGPLGPRSTLHSVHLALSHLALSPNTLPTNVIGKYSKYLGPDGNTIEVKESMKDFGVNITSDLYSPSCKDCGECLKAGRLGTPYI